jgi:hypothetical protein
MQFHRLPSYEANHLLATGMARHCYELRFGRGLGCGHQRG